MSDHYRSILQLSGGVNLLLDDYPNAAVAYSLRKLRTDYTGNSIRVRRSSDNAEQDIGFASGDLDTSSLLSFVGANNGFVTTWYDQSGNANNATQVTASNQPRIVSSGVVNVVNSKPAMSLDGSNDSFDLTSTINVSTSNYNSFVGKRYLSGRRLYGLSAGQTGSYLWALWSDNKYYLQAKTTEYLNSSSTDTSTNQLLLTGLNNNGTMSMFKNGSVISSTAINQSLIMTAKAIGFYANTGLIAHCNLQEIVFYNSEQSTNRTGIESNINDYYSIY